MSLLRSPFKEIIWVIRLSEVLKFPSILKCSASCRSSVLGASFFSSGPKDSIILAASNEVRQLQVDFGANVPEQSTVQTERSYIIDDYYRQSAVRCCIFRF